MCCLDSENAAQNLSNLDALDLDDVLELVETTQDVLDEVWKQDEHAAYPEVRMQHLLDVIAGAFGRYTQKKLGALDIWEGPFQQVQENMKKGMSVCEHWVTACETLTAQFWKRFSMHPWRGDKFVPESLSQLAARLDEVSANPVVTG